MSRPPRILLPHTVVLLTSGKESNRVEDTRNPLSLQPIFDTEKTHKFHKYNR
jgi:hypothetical protein